jgi:hypothetical protein
MKMSRKSTQKINGSRNLKKKEKKMKNLNTELEGVLKCKEKREDRWIILLSSTWRSKKMSDKGCDDYDLDKVKVLVQPILSQVLGSPPSWYALTAWSPAVTNFFHLLSPYLW